MTDQHVTPIHRVFLGLGSNLGDRDAHLAAAVRELTTVGVVKRISSVYDTAPMHVTNQPRFHNLACELETSVSPIELLHVLKDIERRLGREKGPRFGPRVIDIDLLFYDQLVLRTAELTVPHPRIAERTFVLAPLAEIAPSLTHPILGVTIEELLQRLPTCDAQRVGPLPHTER